MSAALESPERELWLPVPGLEKAEVEASSLGRIRYRPGTVPGREPKQIRVTAGSSPGRAIYPTVAIWGRQFRVHQLVLLAFRGPCPEGSESRHLDGNPGNNRIANLVYGTPKENAADKKTYGHRGRIPGHKKARFTFTVPAGLLDDVEAYRGREESRLGIRGWRLTTQRAIRSLILEGLAASRERHEAADEKPAPKASKPKPRKS